MTVDGESWDDSSKFKELSKFSDTAMRPTNKVGQLEASSTEQSWWSIDSQTSRQCIIGPAHEGTSCQPVPTSVLGDEELLAASSLCKL
jgi:hypothetical protein